VPLATILNQRHFLSCAEPGSALPAVIRSAVHERQASGRRHIMALSIVITISKVIFARPFINQGGKVAFCAQQIIDWFAHFNISARTYAVFIRRVHFTRALSAASAVHPAYITAFHSQSLAWLAAAPRIEGSVRHWPCARPSASTRCVLSPFRLPKSARRRPAGQSP